MALMVSIATFLAIAVGFIAIWMFTGTETDQERIRERLESVRKVDQRGEITLDLKLIRDEMLSTVPLLHRIMMRLSWSARLMDLIAQAGLKLKPAKFVLVSGVMGAAGFVLISHFYRMSLISLVVAVVFAALPLAFLLWKRRKRLDKFEEHFPEALDLLGRAVRAGHPFTTGLEMISKEAPEPVAGEFRKTFEEQNFGLPLRDALVNMCERVPLVDVRFFVTALLVQKETGGNLAEILDELSRVIRDRFRIYREVQVKTAQGRLSALIMIALPMVMMLVLNFLNPTYMQGLFRDPLGPTILGVCAVLQIIGSFILWRIVSIKV